MYTFIQEDPSRVPRKVAKRKYHRRKPSQVNPDSTPQLPLQNPDLCTHISSADPAHDPWRAESHADPTSLTQSAQPDKIPRRSHHKMFGPVIPGYVLALREARKSTLQSDICDICSSLKKKYDLTFGSFASIGNGAEFMKEVESFYFDLRTHPDLIISLFNASKLIHDQGSMTLVLSYTDMSLISPFVMNWYNSRSNFRTNKKAGCFYNQFYCKYRKTKKSDFRCSHTLNITIDPNQRLVILRGANKHADDLLSINSFSPPVVLETWCNRYLRIDGSASTGSLRGHLQDQLRDDVQAAISFNSIHPRFYTGIISRFRKIRGTGTPQKTPESLLNDVTQMVHDVEKDQTMWSHFFTVGATPCCLMCRRDFFKDMVTQKRVLLMGTTRDVAIYNGSELISVAYRNKYGRTIVGATAFATADGDTTESVRSFLKALFEVARIHLHLSKSEAFARLQYVIIGDSPGEEKAINEVFNGPGGRSRAVTVMYCQWYRSMNFKNNLIKEVASTMRSALGTLDADKFQELVAKAKEEARAAGVESNVKYIETVCKKSKQWATCLRLKPALLQMSTVSRLESIHGTWKSAVDRGGYGIGSQMHGLQLSRTLQNFFADAANRVVDDRFSRCHTMSKYGYPALDTLGKFVSQKVKEEWKLADIAARGIQPDGDCVFSSSESGKVCQLKDRSSCKFWLEWSLPCKHMFLAALQRSNPSFIDCKSIVEAYGTNGLDTYESDLEDTTEPIPVRLSSDEKLHMKALEEVQAADSLINSTALLVSESMNAHQKDILAKYHGCVYSTNKLLLDTFMGNTTPQQLECMDEVINVLKKHHRYVSHS